MAWQSTPFAVPLVVSAVLSLGLSGYAVDYAREHGWNDTLLWYAVVMAAAAAWSLSSLGMIHSTTLNAKVAWFKFVKASAAVLVIGWLALALAYTGRDELLKPRVLALAGLDPIVFSFVVAPSNGPLHSLFLRPETVVVNNGSFLVLDPTFGPWFYFDAVWSWALVVTGLVLFLRAAVEARQVYRGQALALVVAGVVPLLANVVYTVGAGPYPNVDLTPMSFAVSGVAFWAAIFRYRLLDVVPVARDSVVENMRDGYLVVDPQGRIVDLNPTAERIVRTVAGEDSGDPVGRSAVDLVPALSEPLAAVDGPPGEGAALTDGATPGTNGAGDRGEADQRQTEMVVEVDGRDHHVEATVTPLFDDDRFIGTLVTLRDVTERRSVEQRYQALIENSSDMITVLDEDGTVEYQSPSVRQVMGIPPEAIEGEDIFEYLYEEDSRRLRRLFRERIAEPDFTERFEFRIPDGDGTWRVLEGVGRNLLDDPAVEGVVINSRDITGRKARERELRRQNERLEEFASVVSHDLRNPLSIATIHAENAYDDPERHLPEVENALERMERMIRDILALARQGEAVTDTETVELRAVAEEAWTTVDTAEATLSVEASRELEADRDRLLRALENLFRNAVEHGGPGVTVRVGTVEGGSEGPDGFYVEDDGPGIPAPERDQVFESGFTTRQDGTGFGLAIVKRIAEAHDWEVSVGESAEGGARFEVVGLETVLLEEPAD